MKLTADFVFSVIFGLLFGFFFGLIDSTFFILSQLNLTDYFISHINEPVVVNLMEGGISACISLVISHWIEMHTVGYGVDIMKHPVLDCIGIVLGAMTVCGFYLLFKYKYSTVVVEPVPEAS